MCTEDKLTHSFYACYTSKGGGGGEGKNDLEGIFEQKLALKLWLSTQ